MQDFTQKGIKLLSHPQTSALEGKQALPACVLCFFFGEPSMCWVLHTSRGRQRAYKLRFHSRAMKGDGSPSGRHQYRIHNNIELLIWTCITILKTILK